MDEKKKLMDTRKKLPVIIHIWKYEEGGGREALYFTFSGRNKLEAKKRRQGVYLFIAEVRGELAKSDIQYLTLKYNLRFY